MGDLKISIIGFGKIGQALAAQVLRAGAGVLWIPSPEGVTELMDAGTGDLCSENSFTAAQGMEVHAIDKNPLLSQQFETGLYQSAEPGLQDILVPAFNEKKLRVSASVTSCIGTAAIIFTIPLSVNEQRLPDSRSFINTLLEYAGFLENRIILVIETSLPVGFCRNEVVPALAAAGREHGRDYLLAHSPERIKSGTMLQQLQSVPKIIGGFTTEAAEKAVGLYARFFALDNLAVVNSIEAAELVKMAGMMYRDLNIALANQLAMYAGTIGVDLAALTPLVNADGEAKLLQPGIGVGGHCTPVYPYFMIDSFRRAGLDFTLATEARRINEAMTHYAVTLMGSLGENQNVLVLGLSFRPGVREDAFSPAYSLAELLKLKGLRPVIHDPLYTTEELEMKGFEAVDDLYTADASVLFLVTMHREYQSLDFGTLAVAGLKQVIDGRNSLSRERVEAAGISYVGIGH